MENKQFSLFDAIESEAKPAANEQAAAPVVEKAPVEDTPDRVVSSDNNDNDNAVVAAGGEKTAGMAQGRLFGEEPEQLDKKKAAPVLPAGRAASAPARVSPEEEKLPDLPEDAARRIRYAGEWIEIRPEDVVRLDTLDKIREYLRIECDYPELTRDRTEMQRETVEIQGQNVEIIIPVVKAKKAGQQTLAEYCLHPDQIPAGKRGYLLAREGLFELHRSRVGLVSALANPLDDCISDYGLKDGKASLISWQEGFAFCLPKMPGEILLQAVSFFRLICARFGTEAMLLIYWDPERLRYFIEVPLQVVTRISVDLDGDYLVQNSRLQAECLEVCRLHSHNVMRAVFSETDDAWETANQLYGVFGRLEWSRCEVSYRYRCGDRFIPIDPFDVFSFSRIVLDWPPGCCSFPQEWLEKIVIDHG